jgi:hypothetical protein
VIFRLNLEKWHLTLLSFQPGHDNVSRSTSRQAGPVGGRLTTAMPLIVRETGAGSQLDTLD